MKIQREKLIEALTAVKPGLAKRDIINQATHFIITGKEISTYNDRVCISHPFKMDCDACSVSADEFYKILMRIQSDEIDIDFADGKILIKSKKVNAHLATESGQDILPKIEALKLTKMRTIAKPLPDGFMEAMKLCMFSAATDMTRPILSCLYINDKIVASTDDLRISEFRMKESADCSILFPATSAMELVKFDIKKFAINPKKTWVYFFTVDDAAFCSQLIPGKFPEYERFLKGFGDEAMELPEDMASMVETASILADDEIDSNRQIEIIIDAGKIKCKGQNKIGWIENETRIRTKSSVRFSINADFIMNILRHTHSMFIDGQKALFKSGEFKHVIALKGE